jgi:hypothetical protein
MRTFDHVSRPSRLTPQASAPARCLSPFFNTLLQGLPPFVRGGQGGVSSGEYRRPGFIIREVPVPFFSIRCSAPYYGVPMNDQSLTPGNHPRLGPTRFADWLSRSMPEA